LETLTLLAGIIVFGIGLFFSIWGLAFIQFQDGYDITKNSAMPTGIVVLFAAILILRKYKRDKPSKRNSDNS